MCDTPRMTTELSAPTQCHPLVYHAQFNYTDACHLSFKYPLQKSPLHCFQDAKSSNLSDRYSSLNRPGCSIPSAITTSQLAKKSCGKELFKDRGAVLDFLDGGDTRADTKTYMNILRDCIRSEDLAHGKQVHSHMIQTGFSQDICLGNTLINMYAVCGSVADAHRLFNKMSERNVVTWTVLIAGHVKHGPVEEAVKLFWQMEGNGVKSDNFTFVTALKACGTLGDLEQGKQIHLHIIHSGFKANMFVGNALIDMYSKCGSIQDACRVFDKMCERSVVSWNAMITGYIQFQKDEEAIQLFQQMECQGVEPDEVTLLCVLKACASLPFLEEGKRVHAHIVQSGYESDVFVASTLVDMYAKSGSLKDASQIFHKIPTRNVVTWNAMIAGYANHGNGEEALKFFQWMEDECIRPDEVTYLSVLNSCAILAALQQGKQIHSQILKRGIILDAYLVSALINMYADCGSLEDAHRVFDKTAHLDAGAWNAMIDAFGRHGHAKQAIQLFKEMQLKGIKLDHVTFLCILSSCSHGGLVDEGSSYFCSIMNNHSITATMEHYACMVDLLGRAGYLNEAVDFIDHMPVRPGAIVWRTLLSACRNYKDVQLAVYASECLRMLEPKSDAAYVLLSNMYGAVEQWEDLAKARHEVDATGVTKQADCSWIGKENSVVVFV